MFISKLFYSRAPSCIKSPSPLLVLFSPPWCMNEGPLILMFIPCSHCCGGLHLFLCSCGDHCLFYVALFSRSYTMSLVHILNSMCIFSILCALEDALLRRMCIEFNICISKTKYINELFPSILSLLYQYIIF